MNPHVFREYSIRGIADQELNDDVVVTMGQAIGAFFKRRGGKTLVVGRDTRNSSPRISRALIAGLLQSGLHVTDIGITPTPVHNFATDFYTADGGVMVTASHNPPEYNGLKIRADRTVRGDELREIYQIAVGEHLQGSEVTKLDQKRLRLRHVDVLPHYLERVASCADVQNNLRVVVDGGHGTNGLIVAQLLRDVGCEVVELHCEPDGDFPIRAPDPTAYAALADLSASVRAGGADLGLAYDGDGDRLALADEQGTLVPGDQTIMLLARDVLRRGSARIVYDILCSQALADDVIAHGGEPIMTPNGYAFVQQAMRDTGAALGGEFSGHLFFDLPDFRFDDPILASVKLLNIISQSEHPLSALVADLPTYHSSPQIRLACPDAIKAQVVQQVRNHFEPIYPANSLDGARLDLGDGWAIVRASNTQPALSLRVEATSEERLKLLKTQVLDQVEHWMSHLGQAADASALSA